jgi:hypothetical protein
MLGISVTDVVLTLSRCGRKVIMKGKGKDVGKKEGGVCGVRRGQWVTYYLGVAFNRTVKGRCDETKYDLKATRWMVKVQRKVEMSISCLS